VDWAALEDAWVRAATEHIALEAKRLTDDAFYVAAFWLFFSDGTTVRMPALGMSTVERRAESPMDVWAPPEWTSSVIDIESEALDALYETLDHLDPEEDADDSLTDAHFETLTRVRRRLTASARAGADGFEALPLSDDFVVIILDRAQGDFAEDLVHASVADDVLATLDPSPLSDWA